MFVKSKKVTKEKESIYFKRFKFKFLLLKKRNQHKIDRDLFLQRRKESADEEEEGSKEKSYRGAPVISEL